MSEDFTVFAVFLPDWRGGRYLGRGGRTVQEVSRAKTFETRIWAEHAAANLVRGTLLLRSRMRDMKGMPGEVVERVRYEGRVEVRQLNARREIAHTDELGGVDG